MIHTIKVLALVIHLKLTITFCQLYREEIECLIGGLESLYKENEMLI